MGQLKSYCPRFRAPWHLRAGLAVLAALALALAMTPAAAREERVALTLRDGSIVQARVIVPDAPAPQAAVMLFGGLERGAAALDLIAPTRPVILASFDYPFAVPERADRRNVLRLLPQARRGIHDTFEAIGLLHAHLRARPDVDPARITIIGVSLGAPFAVVSAQRHAIPGLAVIHGFGRVPEVIAHQFALRWGPERWWVPGTARALGSFLGWYADIPDIDAHGAQLLESQRAWMLAAQDDERVPSDITASLRDALIRSDASFDYEVEIGGHLRGEDDPRIPALLARAEAWMRARGLH